MINQRNDGVEKARLNDSHQKLKQCTIVYIAFASNANLQTVID